MSNKKPIVLVGMLGSGKSTVGQKLAHKLQCRSYDSDRLIVESEGIELAEVFDYKGKEYFQNKEFEVIKEALSYGFIVLSTGGESFLYPPTRELILQKATSIWLKVSIEILHERIIRKNTRPQISGSNKLEIIEKMAQDNYAIYEQANYTINTDSKESHHVVANILDVLKTNHLV